MNHRDELLRGYEAGNFLGTVNSLAEGEDRNALALELVTLHNEGLIDIVGAFKSLKNESSDGPDFFLIRYVFEKALPELNAPVLSVMQSVLRLYQEAGQDLMAGTIINSFIGFCEKVPSRPHEVLAEIEANPDNFADLLPATLTAGSHIDNDLFLTQAIRLCKDENIELRRRAVFALGIFDWIEATEMSESAFVVLEGSAKEESDDQILAGVVRSGFNILQKDKTLEPRILEIISIALSKGDEITLHAASEVFGFHTGEITVALIDVLFVHLARVKAANKGTWDNIDYGIAQLLGSSNSEKAVQFLEGLLLTHPDKLTMDVFDSVARKICQNNGLMSKILTRWFLRGDFVLCNAVRQIIDVHKEDDLPLEIDPVELVPADLEHILFVARKIVGFLFMQPISAASALISLMRNITDDEMLDEIGTLLFNPLLIDFTRKTREYVLERSAQESGKVKTTIEKALQSLEIYLKDLRSVGNLVALHPSESQRDAQHRYSSRIMAESFKAAKEKSVLWNLVSHSVLLYGRKSVNYVYGPEGQPQRMEIPLKSHEFTIEDSRMKYLDPIGLDYVLRIFRNEQIKT